MIVIKSVRERKSNIKMNFIFFVICLSEIVSSERCKVFINELSAIDPYKPENKEFIELGTNCENTQVPLRGYKLIGITTGTHRNYAAKIELVVTLWNVHISNQGFYTVGGSLVSKADIKVPNSSIKFTRSFSTDGIISITNFITNANEHLHAIGLLYGRNNAFSDIVLEKNKRYIAINDDIKQILKDHLVDLVVYGRRADYDRCAIFEEIYPQFTNRKYTLREIDRTNGVDYSLNRCSLDSEQFIPEKFKIGVPTPGENNDCTGSHYILEDHIPSLAPSVITHNKYPSDYNIDPDPSELPQCSSSLERSEYFLVQEEAIVVDIERENRLAEKDTCTALQLNPEGANTAQEVDQSNNRKRKIGADKDYSEELEWETEKHFRYLYIFFNFICNTCKPNKCAFTDKVYCNRNFVIIQYLLFFYRNDWIDKIEKHQKHLLPLTTIKRNKKWFQYIYNENSPKDSRYRCRICFNYYDAFGLPKHSKSALANEEGQLRSDKDKNWETISKHATTAGYYHHKILTLIKSVYVY